MLLDVRKVTAVTDYAMIATGASAPQLKAMVFALQTALKEADMPPYRLSGTPESGWMVLDCIDLVIHVFSPEAREYYGVETLWAKATRLP